MIFTEEEKKFLVSILTQLTIKPTEKDSKLIVETVQSIIEKLK